MKKDTKDNRDYAEERIFSFEDILAVKTNLPKILDWKYQLRQLKFVSSLKCKKLEDFAETPLN